MLRSFVAALTAVAAQASDKFLKTDPVYMPIKLKIDGYDVTKYLASPGDCSSDGDKYTCK